MTKHPITALILTPIIGTILVTGAPSVSNVLVLPNAETKTVEIHYNLFHSEGLASTVTVEATNNSQYWVAIKNLSGDVGPAITPGTMKSIHWDANSEWSPELFLNVKVRLRANDEQAGSDQAPTPEGFARIPRGTSFMGSPETEWTIVRTSREPIDPSDEVLHRVTLSKDFFMSKTEVTWTEWNTVRDWALTNGYIDIPKGQNGFEGDENGIHPATLMDWYEAVKWLNAKSEMDGLAPCYTVEGEVYKTGEFSPDCDFNATGYRLPTEAEWEYACRAGSPEAFYTGDLSNPDASPVDPNLDEAGWYEGNSGINTHPVGDPEKADNDFGLRDMHGNVVEWCWDWYGEYPIEDVIDPTGPTTGKNRINRGGAFPFWAVHCRSAYRSNLLPGKSSNSIGFRITRTAQ